MAIAGRRGGDDVLRPALHHIDIGEARMTGRRHELILIAVLLVLLAAVWFWAIPTSTSAFVERGTGDISSRFVPQMATLVMASALLIRLGRLIAASRTGSPVPDALEGLPRRGIIVLASVCGYVALMLLLGFYLASTALAVGLAGFLGERRPLLLAAFPVVLLGVIYVLFEHGFGISLPADRLSHLMADVTG